MQPELWDAWQCTLPLTPICWRTESGLLQISQHSLLFPSKILCLTALITGTRNNILLVWPVCSQNSNRKAAITFLSEGSQTFWCLMMKGVAPFQNIRENNGLNAVFFMAKTKRWPSSCGKPCFFGNVVLVRNQMCWSFPDSENASSVSRYLAAPLSRHRPH